MHKLKRKLLAMLRGIDAILNEKEPRANWLYTFSLSFYVVAP